MNLEELYKSGISTKKTRFLMNPLRQALFKLLKPYFYQLVSENEQKTKEFHENIKDIKNQLKARELDLQAMKDRFNTIEQRLAEMKMQKFTSGKE